MKKFLEQVKKVYKDDRWLFFGLIILIVSAVVLFAHSLIHLSPEAAVVKTGYSDIGSYEGGSWTEMQAAGGYRDGSWTNMLAFAVMAVVLGIVHPILAIKLRSKKGSGMAITFTIFSILLVVLTWVVLGRLLNEG
ncbi:MAG: hypothetical protein Q4E46_02035 [Candidatus Saccharibacteria bacterium]|nr:hypothetical protein [Candidatus Saccharibacteria bacterium]